MSKLTIQKINILSEKLSYTFTDQKLLQQALTHRSSSNKNNERLEFLGDAILEFLISSWLYSNFKFNEGELTRLRSSIVCKESLVEVAKDLQLGEYIQLGPGELKTGGHQRKSILADCLEAIIGAIFIDSDIDQTRVCLFKWFEKKITAIDNRSISKDPKTVLQEIMQAKKNNIPVYELLQVTGSDHKQEFKISCKIDLLEEVIIGIGSNRKKAEQAAARNILKLLGKEQDAR